MAIIGTLGDIVFSVSKETVKTFEGMKWDSSVKYATHDRHLKDTLLEFTGRNADSISFKMNFSAFLGVNPIKEINKLLDAERKGKIMRLVIGNKAYGKYKWVIEKTSKDLERFDNKGNLLIAKVSISLKEYVRR
ncbi:phage tail protein [Tepidibacter formicigenes]|uniref:Phage P2 GpU n=1 Tax=Tepidibacter formicigenes DSM 15518 TaxID=1123349 RepID=A0A1M6LSL6_9FIRM|nr:phage tail protein [Tepidibacter formicigenes]SHJ74092.1 Phage P2 GpU [Tepidibacter formicigenes DSM 15518]